MWVYGFYECNIHGAIPRNKELFSVHVQLQMLSHFWLLRVSNGGAENEASSCTLGK